MIRMGLRAGAVLATAGCVLAAAGSTALAETGAQRAQAFAQAEVAYFASRLPSSLRATSTAAGTTVDTDCFAAADNHVDPQANSSGTPTNPAWYQRDALNQYCGTLRLRDQFTSPAYGYENSTQGDELWLDQLGGQITDGPFHLHGGLTTLVPGSQAADAFRTIKNYEQRTAASVLPVSFTSLDGAQLRGNIFMPPPGTPRLHDGKYPGVVITDGSVQGYQQLYYWAAEGLAQYGYVVMTYDVQGQGDSDLLPSSGNCGPGQVQAGNLVCQGVPYQQNYNFYQGAEDSLNFFLSTPSTRYSGSFNPAYRSLERTDVAIAGHSLGASAVSWAGQCDRRVKAVVAWDDLVPVTMSQCGSNVTIPKADQATTPHAPTLTTTNDYEFNVQPQTGVPNPNGSSTGGGLDGTAGYLSLIKSNVDSEIVSIRNGTHLTYTYVPYVLPSNEIGERVAFYYTLAWLDEYLRGGHDALLPPSDTAYRRLTRLTAYDQSADYNNKVDRAASDVSFGAGTFDASQAAADPTDPAAGNVPYEIKGVSIPDTLSFYYYSEYSLHKPGAQAHQLVTCNDMLAGCPAKQPATP